MNIPYYSNILILWYLCARLVYDDFTSAGTLESVSCRFFGLFIRFSQKAHPKDSIIILKDCVLGMLTAQIAHLRYPNTPNQYIKYAQTINGANI